ncbi:N-fatty-acyl-amino acid synthase/hydrolase PM20D1.2-like [Tubulanus polymorphus]|uniref:N-fatty-acyl-amino acid synthase/hydrolase PM20D1.2-like n=1 Tax=Tubulanus polymorphus TaxID=672921 RepID=UPI003DA56515
MAKFINISSSFLRRLTLVSCLIAFVILFIIISRTISIISKPNIVTSSIRDKPLEIEADRTKIHHFSEALKFKTISWTTTRQEKEEILKFIKFIEKSYPTIHSSQIVEWQVIHNYSLLYKVTGSNQRLKPYMLYGHLDVVPAQSDEWNEPAFEGKIVNNEFIYGRGTIDNKNTVIGVLEALEHRLINGDLPVRSFYIGFGHDEEVGGHHGAANIARLFKSQGVKLEFLLDEGMMVTDGIMPGIKRPVAIVGVTEKGMLTLNLSVTTAGGHSSMPPRETGIGILAAAINRLESNPHPSRIGFSVEKQTFESLASQMNFLGAVVMSNLWLFKPLLSWKMSGIQAGNAQIRTTTAVTMFHAGTKVNVLASKASAIVNHRVHPSQTLEEVLEFDKSIINDERVKIEKMSDWSRGPFPVSPCDEQSFGFQTVKSSIHQIFHKKNVFVIPGILVGNTDSEHFMEFTSNIYRFTPTYLYRGDENRFHGKNERMSIENFEETMNFYLELMKLADRDKLPPPHQHPEL